MLVNIESDHKFNDIGVWEMKSHNAEIYNKIIKKEK
jgi:hypothetical protein